MPRPRTDSSRPRPRIRPRTFPHQDVEFAAAVDQACRRIRGSDRVLIAERVRDLLADRYRRVAVQPQDPLAATAEDLVLYVYRDGRPMVGVHVGASEAYVGGVPVALEGSREARRGAIG